MSPTSAHALAQTDPAALGVRIKAARLAAGLTQPELGGDDASAAYVSRIESGSRRVSAALLESFAQRLGLTVDQLVIGERWEDARRCELNLDLAELSLAGGDADAALASARALQSDPGLDIVPGGRSRAAYVEASALDALGDPGAADAFEALLATGPGPLTRARIATVLGRILRERGEVSAAIARGEQALDGLRPDLIGSEEGIRLAVTLAAALFVAGRVDDATRLCNEAVEEAERLASPTARASAYWNASIVRSETGDLDGALALARHALALLETTERVRDLGRLRLELGAMMLRQTPPDVTEARHQLKLADTELDWSSASLGDVAWHHVVTARALVLDGELEESRSRALKAVDAAREGLLPLVEAESLTLLGQIDWAAGDHDAARNRFRHAISLLTGIGSDREAGELWFELGVLADRAEMVDEARDAYRRAAASVGFASRLAPVVTHQPTRT